MKRIAISLFSLTLALGLGFNASDAEAKRLGGGSSLGMSRSSAPMQRQSTLPPKQANAQAPAAAPAAAPAPAASGMSRWLGPLAGLAAGVGLAALFSHLGMGEGMGSMLMIAALVIGAIFVVRMLLARKQAATPAYAGNVGNNPAARFNALQPAAASAGGTAGAAPAVIEAASVPADFDSAGFLRQAKLNFNRLQAANDVGNMDDIKTFTSPEVFAEVQMQYEERGKTKQQTDVIQLDAELVEVVTEDKRHIASVRFHGQLREESGAAPIAFDEVWHLIKPVDGSEGWRVAGIQQIQ